MNRATTTNNGTPVKAVATVPTALDLDALAERVADKLAALLRTEQERLLDRVELAARLGIAERTVGAMVERHELPPPLLRTSGTARWFWPAVIQFLEGRVGRQVRRGRGRYSREQKEAEESGGPGR